MAKVKFFFWQTKSRSKCHQIISKKENSSKFAEFIQKKWEYYDQIFPSNSIFFAFWRNFAPKTTLLHAPDNKSPLLTRAATNNSSKQFGAPVCCTCVRASEICAVSCGSLFVFWRRILRRCYEPMNTRAHTSMNSRFQKPMNHESCLLSA